jgi:hypothetical protein
VAVVVAAVLASSAVVARGGGAGVTTAGYGTLRDNWDPNEPGLSPSVVQSAGFGELFSTKVAGSVYAQPLVYEGDVIVSTEKADAYAINDKTGAIVWKRAFGRAFKASTIHCSDLKPDIGSTSTPVIDPSTGTLYMTTRLEGKGGLKEAHWYLQAVSAATGEERKGFPVEIAGTPVNTPGVPFNESYEAQRPGLLLLGGVIYIAFASDCDITPYRGIVVGVNESSGAITTMWSDESGVGTNENSQAGIWQSGGGLVSDIPGRIILTTGNGTSPQPAASNAPPPTLSESVIGLTVGASGELTPSQFFAPSNAPTMDENDEDLGSGGPIALPTEYFGTASIPHLVVQVGKDGRIFLINADDMGGYRQGPGGTDAVLQTLGPFTGVWGHPAAYGGQGGWVYVLESGGGGYLRALSYGLNGKGQPALTSEATSSEGFPYTSGSPLVTSNGTDAGSAVVWVQLVEEKHSQLRAYAAMPSEGTLQLLWSAPIGTASKFAVPTAYEGRVYVGTRDGHVIAFGASADAPVQAQPVELGSTPVGEESEATLSVSATSNVTVSGPVTTGGDQGAAGPEPPTKKEARAKTHAAAELTAGPKKAPPSGITPLAAGVITVQQPRVGSAIQAGATLHLRVHFKPRHAGPVVGIISIRTSAGTRTVSVSGYGTHPGLVVSAQPLAFGRVTTGAGGKYLGLTFSNSWNHPERIDGFRLPDGPYSVSGLPSVGTVLAPRQSVTLSVHFNPAHAGSYSSRLEILTNHGGVDLPTSGKASTGRALLAVSAARIDFGSVAVGASESRTFYVSDRGSVPLTISRSIEPEGEFTASVPLPEGITIEQGVEAAVVVTFRPTAVGPATGVYRLNGNDGRGYVTVTFTGRGR